MPGGGQVLGGGQGAGSGSGLVQEGGQGCRKGIRGGTGRG